MLDVLVTFLGPLVTALEFLVQGPINGCKKHVAAQEYNPVVEPETDFQVTHLDEHERARNQEQRQLPTLVAQGITAFVAHDGVHHRETGAKATHKLLDQHESAYDACNGRSLDVDRQGSLVAHARFIALRLEHGDAYDNVKGACSDEPRFGIGNARHQEGAERHKKREPCDNARYNRNFDLVMQNAHDMHVQKAHESRNSVSGPHRKTDCNVGETAGNRNSRRDGLQLRVFQVGAQGAQSGHHENQEPVVNRKM